MKVTNQANAKISNQSEQSLELKKGEVYNAKVKEQLSDRKAVVNIKGKDVTVEFEDKLPKTQDIKITILNSSLETPLVKKVEEQQLANKPSSPFGNVKSASTELQKAIKILENAGVKIDKNNFRDLKAFFEQNNSNILDKLETIKMIANKKLDVTSNHLKAVHEALHGNSIKQLVDTLNISKKDSTQIPTAVDSSKEQIKSTSTNQNEAKSINISNTKEIIHLAKQMLQQEPQLTKALQIIKDGIIDNPQIEREAATKIEKAIVEAKQLQQTGRGNAARQMVLQALDKVELELMTKGTIKPEQQQELSKSKIQPQTQLTKAVDSPETQLKSTSSNEVDTRPIDVSEDKGDLPQPKQTQQQESQPTQADQQSKQQIQVQSTNNDYQTAVNIQQSIALETKDLIVKEITKRLSIATQQFRDFKRDVTNNIDKLTRTIESTNRNVYQYTKPVLETTIDILDNAILKSEITLFTDMKTEKNLLESSSRLAEARKYIANGENQKAAEILHDVKRTLEQLNWQPSKTKVQHFLTKESPMLSNISMEDKVKMQMGQIISNSNIEQQSARGTFEMIRSLGLNYDSELAQSLTDSSTNNHDEHQKSMKATILKLLSGHDNIENSNVKQFADQALHSITGQQLLSRADANTSAQTMFFNIPIQLEEQAENVKIYINAKKDGTKIDWENNSLYFLIDTKKMGETGVLLSTTDRNLSITIKNDQHDFKRKIEPLVKKYTDNLKDIGYNIAGIKFAPLTVIEEQQQKQPTIVNKKTMDNTTNPYQKGFDFKV